MNSGKRSKVGSTIGREKLTRTSPKLDTSEIIGFGGGKYFGVLSSSVNSLSSFTTLTLNDTVFEEPYLSDKVSLIS